MTAEDFRRIALGMDGATESAHMAHPDFRVNGRLFATLHRDHLSGMVKLRIDRPARNLTAACSGRRCAPPLMPSVRRQGGPQT